MMEDITDIINNLLIVQPKKKHTLQHWHKELVINAKITTVNSFDPGTTSEE